MDKKKLKALYDRYQLGTLSGEELYQWEQALADLGNEGQLLALIDPVWGDPALMAPEITGAERQRMYEAIVALPQGQREARVLPRQKRLWPRIGIAAAVATLIFSAALYYYVSHHQEGTAATIAYANDIAPGGNGATLTLSDGRKVLINDAVAGDIASEAGVKIVKGADGQLMYELTTDNKGEIAFNTLSTTRGQQSQVRLPDGSLVFLNAESSLKYPTRFASEGKREVSLTGEGYFEVAKDKAHPFVVSAGGQVVEVLGTHFNINNYTDEPQSRTTLLEGSVKISGGQAKNNILLKPGEQALLGPAGAISVEQADVSEAVAWRAGKFVFDGEPIESVMRKLARWYNVEVVYEGDLSKKTFDGSISRYDNISKILEKITFTEAAHFKIEGRRITVMR